MSFRAKLIFLVVLTNLLLGGVVWQMVTGVQKIKKQVQLFVPAVDYLQRISAINSSITHQAKGVVDYLVLHDEGDRVAFIARSEDLEKSFQLWRQSASQQDALGIKGKESDLLLIDEIYSDYQHWQISMLKVFDLAASGDWKQAQDRFHQSWSSSLEKKLLPAITVAHKNGMTEVEHSFHRLLLAVGMVPWGAEKNTFLLKQIHTSMNFLIGGNLVNASVNNQFAMLVDFLLHNNEKSLHHFYRSQVTGDEALANWLQVAKQQDLLSSDLEINAPLTITSITSTYQLFSQQAAHAIALKKSEQTIAALQMIVKHEDQVISDFHNKISLAVSEGAGALLSRVSVFRMKGLMLLAVFLVASSLLSLRMVKDMLSSLHILKSGMAAIDAGDRTHRINIKKTDIMGTLAQTFNSMMDSMLQTQTSLEKLTTELEQRVEERTAQLKSANKSLEAFNAMVSHDLRAPLTTLSGYGQLLLLNHEENSPEQNEEDINKIVDASESMSRIVTSLESLTQARHKTLRLEPVDLTAIATKVLDQLSARDPDRQIERIISQVPKAIGDRGLIEIVMTNLLDNAWKYTSKVETAKIEFGTQLYSGAQVWYIRDNGVGFDMNNVNQLFKTFSRLHSKEDFLGTGIGLSTVHRIIYRHGGKIWAEGKEGQGATFYFHLGQESSGADLA